MNWFTVAGSPFEKTIHHERHETHENKNVLMALGSGSFSCVSWFKDLLTVERNELECQFSMAEFHRFLDVRFLGCELIGRLQLADAWQGLLGNMLFHER